MVRSIRKNRRRAIAGDGLVALQVELVREQERVRELSHSIDAMSIGITALTEERDALKRRVTELERK